MSGEAGNMPAAESSSAYEGVGNSLKVVRERQGLSLPDVASRTRIRRQHLAAIEAGHFAELPGPVYITGFLRTYAETLGLDPETVVSRFQEESDLARQRQDLVFPMPRPEARSPRWWLVLVALAAAVAAYLVWYHYQEAFRRGAELVKAVPSRLAELVPPPTPIAAAPPRITPPPAAPGAAAPAPNASPAPSPATSLASTTGPTPATPTPAMPAGAAPASNTAAANPATPPAQTSHNPGSVGPAPVSAAAASPKPAAASNGAAPLTLGPAPVPASPAPAMPAAAAPQAPASQAPASQATASQATAALASAPAPAPAPAQSPSPAPVTPSTAVQVAAAPANTAPANTAPANPAATLGPVTQQQAQAGTRFGSSDPARLLVRADATSWVQVRGPNNEPIFTRLMGAGETYAVPARDGLTLATGNAGGISLLLDGSPLPRLGDTGEVKRGLPLDPSGIKASLKVE